MRRSFQFEVHHLTCIEQEKEEKRVKKEEEKAKKAEEKRLREENRKSKSGIKVAAGALFGSAAAGEQAGETTADAGAVSASPSGGDQTAEAEVEPKFSEDVDLERYETAESGASEELEASHDSIEVPEASAEESVDKAKKHDAPVSSRIAPTVTGPVAPAATTETTISGPSKSPKEKDSGKVSSWLKSKLSRRSSKPQKPEAATITAATNSSGTAPSVGAAPGSTAITEVTSNPSDRGGEDSMREVAIAGKDFAAPKTSATGEHAGTTTALGAHPTYITDATAPPIVSPQSEKDLSAEMYDQSDLDEQGHPSHRQQLRESTSSPEISSLSSDEDPRGRSNIRLADSMGLPHNTTQHDVPAVREPAAESAEESAPAVESLMQHQQPVNKRAGMVVADLPASAIAAAGGDPPAEAESTGADANNEEDEKLGSLLPPAVVPAVKEEVEGRPSTGSPARDSRFVEVL